MCVDHKWILDVSGFRGAPGYYTAFEDGYLKQFVLPPGKFNADKKPNGKHPINCIL